MVNIELVQALNTEMDAQSNWRVNPQIAGGGYFYDLGSHQLDLLDFLFGPIEDASGFSSNQSGYYPADDITVASFLFKNGIIGNGYWCFNAGSQSTKDNITIIGESGYIKFDTFSDFNVYLESEHEGSRKFEFEKPEHIQEPLIKQVVGELTGKNICVSTGKTGARTNYVIDKICGKI